MVLFCQGLKGVYRFNPYGLWIISFYCVVEFTINFQIKAQGLYKFKGFLVASICVGYI